jgi:hypothetical protein
MGMKDARGHGSNTHGGIASTFAAEAAQRQAFGNRNAGGGIASTFADETTQRQNFGRVTSNAEAARALASTLKSTQAPIHSAMDRTMVAGDDSDGTDAWSRTPGGDRGPRYSSKELAADDRRRELL